VTAALLQVEAKLGAKAPIDKQQIPNKFQYAKILIPKSASSDF
jgi:hypothetical protein